MNQFSLSTVSFYCIKVANSARNEISCEQLVLGIQVSKNRARKRPEDGCTETKRQETMTLHFWYFLIYKNETQVQF